MTIKLGENSAQSIIALCDSCLPAHSNNCSGFVKAVADKCGVLLSGQANDIIDTITIGGGAWKLLGSGAEAAKAAEEGKFVIGGRKANPNGHVVVVVRGPLVRGQYPYAYWGQYRALRSFDGTVYNVGFTRGHGTINWAWGQYDRDRVRYAAIDPLATLLHGNKPEDYQQRGRLQF